MILPLVVTLTVLLFFSWIYVAKKFTFIEYSIIFMLMGIVTTNILTIISLNLKWVTIPNENLLYLALVIIRTLLIPMVSVFFINELYKNKSIAKKFFTSGFIFIIIFLIEYGCIKFNLIKILNLKLELSLLIPFILQLVAFILSKMIFYIRRKGSKKHEGV